MASAKKAFQVWGVHNTVKARATVSRSLVSKTIDCHLIERGEKTDFDQSASPSRVAQTRACWHRDQGKQNTRNKRKCGVWCWLDRRSTVRIEQRLSLPLTRVSKLWNTLWASLNLFKVLCFIMHIEKENSCLLYPSYRLYDKTGKILEVSRGVHCQDKKDPLGVVASIGMQFLFGMIIGKWSEQLIALEINNSAIQFSYHGSFLDYSNCSWYWQLRHSEAIREGANHNVARSTDFQGSWITRRLPSNSERNRPCRRRFPQHNHSISYGIVINPFDLFQTKLSATILISKLWPLLELPKSLKLSRSVAGILTREYECIRRCSFHETTNFVEKVLALGGAKNHLVAAPDCDIVMTASDVTASFSGCSGQVSIPPFVRNA